MERPDLKQALGRLLGPAGPEVGCDECFEQLDRYVELELAGADADAVQPAGHSSSWASALRADDVIAEPPRRPTTVT